MRLLFLAVLGALLAVAPARAATPLETERAGAVAMVNRVVQMYHQQGQAATFKAVDDRSNPAFHQGDLYAFIFTLEGVCVAHGARPALIGKNLIDLTDPTGEYTVRKSIAIAKGPGHGWFDYEWPVPYGNRIEKKTAYIVRMGNYFVGVGFYTP